MNGLSLSNEQAIKAMTDNKEQCIEAFRSLAKAAASRTGKFLLLINSSGTLSVAEDESGGHGKIIADNDLCIYITDSKYKDKLIYLIGDDEIWQRVYDNVVNNLKNNKKYSPYVLCENQSDIELIVEILKHQREEEYKELKIYTPEQIFTKEQIESVFKDTGMENVAKDEYRKNAFSFDYIARERVTFSGDNSPNFWSLFLMPRTTFFINALTDEPFGVEFEFGYDLKE